MNVGSFPPKADPSEFPRGSRKAHMYKSARTPPSRPFDSRETLLKASSVASVPTIPTYECRTSTTSLPWSSTYFLISERMQSALLYIVIVGALPNDGWQGHEEGKPLASKKVHHRCEMDWTVPRSVNEDDRWLRFGYHDVLVWSGLELSKINCSLERFFDENSKASDRTIRSA